MKKVYCKDCKYAIKGIICSNNEEGVFSSVDLLNHGNKCKKYKRKWWKFWVK